MFQLLKLIPEKSTLFTMSEELNLSLAKLSINTLLNNLTLDNVNALSKELAERMFGKMYICVYDELEEDSTTSETFGNLRLIYADNEEDLYIKMVRDPYFISMLNWVKKSFCEERLFGVDDWDDRIEDQIIEKIKNNPEFKARVIEEAKKLTGISIHFKTVHEFVKESKSRQGCY